VLSTPADDVTDSDDTVATCVSYVIVVAELAVLLFEAASVNVPSATETEPVPLCVFAVGVNDTVYEVPEPVNDVSAPPLTVMSPTTKLVDASDNVNVSVDVWLERNEVELAEIDTVGAVVSTVTVRLDEVDVTVESASRVVEIAVIALSPAVSTPVSHVHTPVVELVVHVLPETTPSTYNCTVEPTGAEPVKVSVVADVMLSVEEVPKSSVASRSGVEVLGST
jgi:hypothetical protein